MGCIKRLKIKNPPESKVDENVLVVLWGFAKNLITTITIEITMGGNIYRKILTELKKRKISSQKQLNNLKIEMLQGSMHDKIPTNVELANYATPAERKKFRNLLTIKPTRSLSGVSVVAIMTSPKKCPHGKCSMCPGGVDSVFGDVPQSYTGKEPATRRAIRNLYDSYLQVFNRLEQYMAMNKIPDKVELIVMGGTFPSYNVRYQDMFVKNSFQAMNDFGQYFFSNNRFNFKKFCNFFELPGDIEEKGRTKRINRRSLKLKKATMLAKEQKKNETGKIRCVALCVETRPDYCKKQHINQMLKLGTTRVELGVQSVYDEALKRISRGHAVADSVKATQLLKDSFLKVGYHMMPGLPGVSFKEDIINLRKLFTDQRFMPDALKIYPCMVLEGTKLYKQWKAGKYSPMTTKQATKLIAEFKRYVPEMVRIMRVQRDIPTYVTEAGVDRTNLRQYVDEYCKDHHINCMCIRCREIGHVNSKIGNEFKIFRHDYEASNGTDVFLSYEDVKRKALLGFLRLRMPFNPFRKEITEGSVGIRELHVYGDAAAIGSKGKIQHRGIGKKLVVNAEKIAAEEFDAKKILITSGVGVRDYYRKKFGYSIDGPYMSKSIK